jgi:hypothetical protein
MPRALWVALLCFAASPSLAQQPPCGPTGTVEKRIKDQYGESLIGAGIVAGGILFTTMNPTTQTFTVFLRRHDGQTCVLMGGTGWAVQDAEKPGKNL